MQEQNTYEQQIPSQEQVNRVGQLVRLIYLGQNTEQIKLSQQKLIECLEYHPHYFQMIINFLRPDFDADHNFKQACCSILKSYCFKIAQNLQLNKTKHIESIYYLLVETQGFLPQYKQVLGKAIQYIVNNDQKQQYKGHLINNIAKKFEHILKFPEEWDNHTIETIYGLGLLTLAYMNSIVQPEQLIKFFFEFLPILGKTTAHVLKLTQSLLEGGQNSKQINFIFSEVKILFQIIQIALERLFEEGDIIQEQLRDIKSSQVLYNILIDYLYAFSEENSMLTSFNKLNAIKQSILETVYILNMNILGAVPHPILKIVFTTFTIESLQNRSKKRDQEQDDHVQQLLCRCVEIIQYQLASGINKNFFNDYKIDILFAILMYSKTTQTQIEYLTGVPEKYVEIAQQFTQSFSRSPIIKVRAANLLKVFLRVFDEGLKNLLQLIIMFITGSLSNQDNQSDMLKSIKNQFSTYQFWGLQPYQKLDIAFMVLSAITPEISQRPDLYQIVMAILLTQVQTFGKIENKIVITRLIRLIGYYPTTIYFSYIRSQMERDKVLMIESVCAFQRIAKNQQFMKVFPYMDLIFLDLLDFIDVSDSIFQQLVMNNFQRIIQKNQELYTKVLIKLNQTFKETIGNGQTVSKQKTLLSLNYLFKIMKRQKSDERSEIIEKCFLDLQKQGRNIPLLEDSFIDIYQLLTDKYIMLDHKILEFALDFGTIEKLSKYNASTNYFRFVNKILKKVDNSVFVSTLYNNFTQYLFSSVEQNINSSILKQMCFTLGKMIVTYKSLGFRQNLCISVSNRALSKNSSSVWYLYLFFHILYFYPQATKQCLIVNDIYYSMMLLIFAQYFKSKLQRKVGVLALQQLLVYEPQIKRGQQIVKFCLKVLSEQKRVYSIKPKKKNYRKEHKPAEMRRMLAQYQYQPVQQQQSRTNQDYKQENGLFAGLSHPFDSIDQFEAFKHRISMLYNGQGSGQNQIVSMNDINQLKKILQNVWHKDRVRKIFKVEKQF